MCDSAVVTAPYTLEGTTLFAKNSDRHADECQPFLSFPAAFHPRGAKVRCTHITIPQVAESYGVMGHSPWWLWGFEHGVNEHGVAIGNQSVFSREPVEEKPGLIGMDLVRLGLERGRDAREALEVIAGLIETFGQGGAGFGPGESGYHNSFMVADPQQGWLLETSGRHWAARRVDHDAASNHITLGADWRIGSRDLESFARGAGWWSGRERLDVASAYRNPNVPAFLSEGRIRRARSLLDDGRGKHDVAGMARMLRDHGCAGAPPQIERAQDDEARYSLCMHAEPVGTTTASMIAPLPTELSGAWPVWISFASPCMGIFIPVYIDGVLPACLARGGDDGPTGDADSYWWRMRRLQAAASVDFARTLPVLRRGWAPVEEQIEDERQRVEREARSLAVAGETVEAARALSDFMASSVALVLERADDLYEEVTR
jgi:secernin